MQTVYHIKATVAVKTRARQFTHTANDNIPAASAADAIRAFREAWSAPNIIVEKPFAVAIAKSYTPEHQPKNYTFQGYWFDDGDIAKVFVNESDRVFHFVTRSGRCDLQIGLAWTKDEFAELFNKLKTELQLT